MTVGGIEEAVAGAALGVAAQELYRATVAAIKSASSFKHELELLQFTLRTMNPMIYQIEQLTSKSPQGFPKEVVEQIQMFKLLLVRGKALVATCSKIPSWRIFKKYRYAKKLRVLNESLGNLNKIQLLLHVILIVLTQTNSQAPETKKHRRKKRCGIWCCFCPARMESQ